jgi:hypothetical protein
MSKGESVAIHYSQTSSSSLASLRILASPYPIRGVCPSAVVLTLCANLTAEADKLGSHPYVQPPLRWEEELGLLV